MVTQGQKDIHGVAGMHANVDVWPEMIDSRYDWHLRHGADPRDPRCVGAPCLGNHQTIKKGRFIDAAYYRCMDEKCQLRILYVPRAGASADRQAPHPLPADLTGFPEPDAPTEEQLTQTDWTIMPYLGTDFVPGMTPPEPQQVENRYKQSPGRCVPCGMQTRAVPKPAPKSQAKATPWESWTPAPPASPPPLALGASSLTSPAPPSSMPTASPTPDVAQSLGQVMYAMGLLDGGGLEGINAMNDRLNQTEQASMQAARTQVEAYFGLPQPATVTPWSPRQTPPALPVGTRHIPGNDPNRSVDEAVPRESDDEQDLEL